MRRHRAVLVAALSLALGACATSAPSAAPPGAPSTSASSTSAPGGRTSAAHPGAAAYPDTAAAPSLRAGRPAWVAVSVATLWRSPSAPREVDAPALAASARIGQWLGAMSVGERRGLNGRADTRALLGDRIRVVRLRPRWARVAVPSQPSPQDRRGYPGWVPRRQLTATRPAVADRIGHRHPAHDVAARGPRRPSAVPHQLRDGAPRARRGADLRPRRGTDRARASARPHGRHRPRPRRRRPRPGPGERGAHRDLFPRVALPLGRSVRVRPRLLGAHLALLPGAPQPHPPGHLAPVPGRDPRARAATR